MALTYTAIATVTVGSGGAADIEFTSIPATYTDLKLVYSVRNSNSNNNEGVYISFNGSTSDFTGKYLDGTGTTTRSGSLARYVGVEVANDDTASTFANNEIYIPNYAGSNNKSFSGDSVTETNATQAFATFIAGLWSNTAAITSIKLTLTSTINFAQYSTATLYGIKNTV